MTEHLITTRRNFLLRASAVTAAGATVAVPIVTVADAKAHIEHHSQALLRAMKDYYVGLDVRFAGNHHTPDQVREWDASAHYQFTASVLRSPENDPRPTISSWREYDRWRSALDKALLVEA